MYDNIVEHCPSDCKLIWSTFLIGQVNNSWMWLQ